METFQRYTLLVDDDGDMRDVVAEVLRGEGLAVSSVSNGLDALEHVGTYGVPSLVIMDLTMPIMDGKQFLAERRKWSCLAQVPFVVLTGNALATAKDLGVADVLHKPVDLTRLVAIARLYGRPDSGSYRVSENTKVHS